MENTLPAYSEKSGVLALVLVFFLGWFGIHRFYAGKIGTGVVMVLLTLTGVGLVVTGIWAIVDFFMILTNNFRDNQGKVMKL